MSGDACRQDQDLAVHKDAAMPEIGLTDEEARDIAAYLYTYK